MTVTSITCAGGFPPEMRIGQEFDIPGHGRYRIVEILGDTAHAGPPATAPRAPLMPRATTPPWYRQFEKRGRR